MRCKQCKGPFHEATGHLWDSDYPICGACYKGFLKWLSGHTKQKWDGHWFYKEAATSVRAGVWPVKMNDS